jgi:hypothetical protein
LLLDPASSRSIDTGPKRFFCHPISHRSANAPCQRVTYNFQLQKIYFYFKAATQFRAAMTFELPKISDAQMMVISWHLHLTAMTISFGGAYIAALFGRDLVGGLPSCNCSWAAQQQPATDYS